MTYVTFAHSLYDRVLVTEVNLQRSQTSTGDIVTVLRNDLSGEEGEEFSYLQPEFEYSPGKL